MADSVFGIAKDTDVKFELCRKASFSKMLAKKSRTPAVKLEGEDEELCKKKDYMWKLMESYLPVTPEAIQRGIVNHVVSLLTLDTTHKLKFSCYIVAQPRL